MRVWGLGFTATEEGRIGDVSGVSWTDELFGWRQITKNLGFRV